MPIPLPLLPPSSESPHRVWLSQSPLTKETPFSKAPETSLLRSPPARRSQCSFCVISSAGQRARRSLLLETPWVLQDGCPSGGHEQAACGANCWGSLSTSRHPAGPTPRAGYPSDLVASEPHALSPFHHQDLSLFLPPAGALPYLPSFTALLSPAEQRVQLPWTQKLPPSCCFIHSIHHHPTHPCLLTSSDVLPVCQAAAPAGSSELCSSCCYIPPPTGSTCSAMRHQTHNSGLFLGVSRAQGSPFLLKRPRESEVINVTWLDSLVKRDHGFNPIFTPGSAPSFGDWGCSCNPERRGGAPTVTGDPGAGHRAGGGRACPRQGRAMPAVRAGSDNRAGGT